MIFLYHLGNTVRLTASKTELFLNLKIVSRDVLIEVSDSNTYRVKLDILGSPFHPINSTTAHIQKVLKGKRSAKKADQFKYTCRKREKKSTFIGGIYTRSKK